MREKSFRDAQFISRRYMAITFQMGKKTGIQVRKQSKKYLHELKKQFLVLKEAIKCQAILNIVRHILTQFILKIKVSKENQMDHLHQREKNRLSLTLEYSTNADAQRS